MYKSKNKRKKKYFYAVKKGFKTGIFSSWNEAEKQVKGYPGAIYKKFENRADAEYFLETGKGSSNSNVINIGKTGKSSVSIKKVQRTLQDYNYKVVTVNQKKGKKDKRISVWTDGSSINNGYKNCKAGCGVFFGEDDPRNCSEMLKKHPSNQRAELKAILIALKLIPENEKVRVYTDSRYSIKCITEWAINWKINGWKTTKDEPVKHKDIIKKLYKIYRNRNIKFVHVRSHRSAPRDKFSREYTIWYGNYMADKLAGEALKNILV